MNIAQMKVAIRPMSTAQAVDLGMMMARHWFVPLWKIWVGMALPVFLMFSIGSLLLGTMTESSIGLWGGMIFWWLKPLYEKPLLIWLSQALFDKTPDVVDTVKQGWRDAKYFAPSLLLRYRLSPQRQLIIPIALLERPDKSQFKTRLSILSRGQGGGLTWHTLIMANIEMMIAIAVAITLYALIPTSFMSAEALFDYMETSPFWFNLLWAMFYFLAASIIAPFFIAGGFAVYLTKRCLLEGWDVELVFKQLRYRYEQTRANPLTTLKENSHLRQAVQHNNRGVSSTSIDIDTSEVSTRKARSRPMNANKNNDFLNQSGSK